MSEHEYEGNKYYGYTIEPVTRERDLKAVEKIKAAVTDAIKEYRETEKQVDDDSIDFEF